MSRRLIVPATLLSLLGILSCEKSEVVSPVPGVSPASEIAGTIVGWNLGDSMAISASASPGYVIAAGAVRHDGTFALSLAQPTAAALWTVTGPYDTLSDTTARVATFIGLTISEPEQSVQYVAQNQLRVSPETFASGDAIVEYVYTTRQLRWKRVPVPGLSSEESFELRLQAGWNRIIWRETGTPSHPVATASRADGVVVPTWYIIGRLPHSQENDWWKSHSLSPGFVR